MKPLCAYCAFFAVFMYSVKLDLLLHVSSPLSSMKLNLVVVPGFQMTDNAVPFLGPIPDNPHEIPKFLSKSLRAASDTFLKFGTTKYPLRPLFAIGLDSKKEIFPPSSFKDEQDQPYPAQESSKFDKPAVLSLNNDFPAAELLLLEAAFKTDAFKKHEPHHYLQTQLRSLVDHAMMDHSIHGHRYKSYSANSTIRRTYIKVLVPWSTW